MDQITHNGKTFQDETLNELDGFIGDALASDELQVDTLTAVVTDPSLELRLLAADGLLVSAEGLPLVAALDRFGLDARSRYGDVVRHYRGNALFGKFFLETIKRVGKSRYQLNCISAIGLLLTSYHYGGLYTGQTVAEVAAEIIGGVVDYTLDATLGAVPVYGLLRKATRRDNLRDLLFAVGGQIRKDTAGELHIIPMEAGTPYEITADEFYMGGSVTGKNPATGVSVTEHSFMALPSDPEETLFDGTAAAEELVTPGGKTVSGVLVDFSEPMHDLSAQNAEILESGANYAVLSGSPAAILTGKRYTHTTRIVSRKQSTGGSPNIVTSSTCELVNFLNSELVADRLMAYYGSGKTIEAEFVVTGQKPGDAVTFTDPFGNATTGYIADMELSMSAILKAKATLIAGFTPTASGNYYANFMVITASGTVAIPAEVKGKGLLVLIGGGTGGSLGEDGEDGASASSSSYGTGGKGGAPGTPGAGGKISVRNIPLQAGQQVTVRIGAGGKGQTLTTAATAGGATTFGAYSSEDGYSSPDGYINLVSGDIYGIPGEEGVSGGAGGGPDAEGESIAYGGVTYTPGAMGADASRSSYWAKGGYGGGPAVGANGGKGGDGSSERQSDGSTFSDGGDGGGGATPVKAGSGTTPGQGGQAGHGGGGGGGGGPASGSSSSYEWYGGGGAGGAGGEGGDGADGIAILYY